MKLHLLTVLGLTTSLTLLIAACQSSGRAADCPDLDACLEAIDGTAGSSAVGTGGTSATGGASFGGFGGFGGVGANGP